MLKGGRQLKAHELEKAALYLGIPQPGHEDTGDFQQSEQLVEVLKLIERLCGPENTNDDPYRDIRLVVRLALQQHMTSKRAREEQQ
jgi:hypothetical protein